jgi:hypothetical protein
MIRSFNLPRSSEDVNKLVFYALHQALSGTGVLVTLQGDAIQVEWPRRPGCDVPDTVENGHITFLDDAEYFLFQRLRNNGTLAAYELLTPTTNGENGELSGGADTRFCVDPL